MILFPNCKINIGLDILRRRQDGYHDIETVIYPVPGLNDGLEIIRTGSGRTEISFSGDEPGCPPEENLVMRAWRAMHERYGIGCVRMHLHKKIPSGAGLGGGSSDAAFTIKGLDELFGLNRPQAELEEIAATLGSDVPLFIRNTPQLCTGRGEIMTPVELPLAGKYLLIVKPDIHISTAEAYSGVIPALPATPLRERITLPPATWRDTIENAFEASIFAAHPQIEALKKSIYGCGALYAAMSGSGSAVFGIFDSEPLCASRVYGESFLVRL